MRGRDVKVDITICLPGKGPIKITDVDLKKNLAVLRYAHKHNVSIEEAVRALKRKGR